MNFPANVLITGIGATLLVDLWAWLRRQLFGTPLPDYRLVGRWIAYMPRGRFRHESIAASTALRGEHLLGWLTHYLTGIAFAAILQILVGMHQRPALAPALLFGIATVAAPFLVMQPGMGAGIAASRSRRPGAARLQSLLTHAVFGLGLYLAGNFIPLRP